ncbi:hypothetical protein E2C01_052178 [Portunus trituberculatus]|uniref:Uncharacterized protein n=1 Tax=Portunus trituberculatus TaxID=210409 RepID=A0A5B7GGV5_PORTR|nr:hypothetical protein [Portunus trituberculatus]
MPVSLQVMRCVWPSSRPAPHWPQLTGSLLPLMCGRVCQAAAIAIPPPSCKFYLLKLHSECYT